MQNDGQLEAQELPLKTRQGKMLFGRLWQGQANPSTAILLIHGYGEHSGRYQHIAGALQKINAAVYSFDLTGHGKSEGISAYIDRFDHYVDEAEDALQMLGKRYQNLPLYVIGHSMGGLIAAYLALRRQQQINGLITSGGALKVNEDLSPFLVKISGLLSVLLPKMPAVKLSSDLISTDPEVVAKYENDPLIYHGGTRCRTGAEVIRASREIAAKFDQLTLPLLIMHGAADKLTDPQGSRQLHQQAASKDKTLHIFDGLRHEIFNEPQREMVIKTVVEWISKRLK